MSKWFFSGLAPFAALGLVLTSAAPPVTTRYRVESKTEQVVDLSGLGQGSQTLNFTQVAILAIASNDTTGGRTIHVVVDSIHTDAQVPGAAEAAQRAKGAWLHGIVDDWGRTRIVATSADSNEIVGQIKNSLIRFFPVVKPGTKQGDAWVDTANIESKTPAQAMNTVTVTTYTRGGTESREGVNATRIDAKSSTSGAGTMENPQAGTMEVELNDSSTETFFVAPDGRYLGGESRSEGKSKVRMAVVPDPIPVTTTRTTTVTIVK